MPETKEARKPFNVAELNLDDNESVEMGDSDAWTPPTRFAAPPPAGLYPMVINQIYEVRKIGADGKHLEFVLDLTIVGGPYDGRTLRFMRVTTWPDFTRGQSQVMDLLRASGVGVGRLKNVSQKKLYELVEEMATKGKGFSVEIDWEAADWDHRRALLSEWTGKLDAKEASSEATRQQHKDATRAAYVARNYREFPDLPDGKGKLHELVHPDSGAKVQARAFIRRICSE